MRQEIVLVTLVAWLAHLTPFCVQSVEITWGGNFGSVSSENVPFDCAHGGGKSTCCSNFNGLSNEEKKTLFANSTRGAEAPRRRSCTVKRLYIPSPYEVRHIEFAASLATMTADAADKALVAFIVTDVEINEAVLWLERVKYRMKNRGQYTEVSNDDDFKYMSRFRVTKRCPHSKLDAEWDEWIEPLSVHARHPFAVGGCGRNDIFEMLKKKANYPGAKGIMDVDYVLTLSGDVFSNHTYSKSLLHTGQRHGGITKRFLFDAGTSTFDSSLNWFTCAYSQNKLYMDSIFGWEMTLLEPKAFWEGVPDPIRESYNFYNIPVSANISSKSNPLRIIKDLATPDDFVAFKLDIDTPTVEVPIALDILANPDIALLIDEFFFELHFNCPLLRGCWGPVPESTNGLKLDRISAMNLFQKYRVMGIRSHFWP